MMLLSEIKFYETKWFGLGSILAYKHVNIEAPISHLICTGTKQYMYLITLNEYKL